MKLLSSVLICLFLSFNASAQVYKFRATSFSVMEKRADGKWGSWTDFEKSTVVITLDGGKNRLTIASHEIQVYKIVAYLKEFQDTVTLDCVDNDGGRCTVEIMTRKNQGNRQQVYVNYDDVKFVYNIYNEPKDAEKKK